MDPVFCVMLYSGQMNSALGRILLRAAQQAIRENRSEVVVRDDDSFSIVRTQRKYATIGAVTGIMFHGKTESRAGSAEIEFIVRARDLVDTDIDKLTATPFTLNVSRRPASSAN